MAAVAVNHSDALRTQGNEFFRQAKTNGMAPVVKKAKLEKAISCYNGALRAASNADQKASASKNIAKASWEIILVIDKKVSSFKLIVYYFKETMSNFDSAIKFGRMSKPHTWVDDLKSSQEECLVAVFASISELPLDCRTGLINTFGGSMERKSLVVMCHAEMAQVLFRSAVVAQEAMDFKRSLHSLKECYRPIEEMKRQGAGDPHIMSEARVLDDDVILHTASAESMQAVVTGDELLRKAVMDSEELKMSLVMEVMDWYTKAVMLARDVEIELEAMASSRIGKVYDQVLKMPCNAKKYFMHAITLAHSLAPRNFISRDWFKLARDTVDKYQHESLVEVQKREEEAREKHLKDMKAELKQLNGFRDTFKNHDKHYLLLVNVYKTFPPKNKAHKLHNTEAELKAMDMAALKKVFLKACIHYHPDKQDTKEGMAWKYFSAEITKIFTCTYERYKSSIFVAPEEKAQKSEPDDKGKKRERSPDSTPSASGEQQNADGYESVIRKKIMKREVPDKEKFEVDESGNVVVYTGGFCEFHARHGAMAGLGVYFGPNSPLNISEPVRGSATCSTAEIQAITYALEFIKRAGFTKAVINTDSQFVISCMTFWLNGWKKKGWKKSDGSAIPNKQDLVDLDKATDGLTVKCNYVKDHSGQEGNERADELAKAGAKHYDADIKE